MPRIGPYIVKRRRTCARCGRVLLRGEEYWLIGGKTYCPSCARIHCMRGIMRELDAEYKRVLKSIEKQHWQRYRPEVFLTLLIHDLLPPLENDLYDDEKLTIMIRLLRAAQESRYMRILEQLGHTPDEIADAFLSNKQWYIDWKRRHPLAAQRTSTGQREANG